VKNIITALTRHICDIYAQKHFACNTKCTARFTTDLAITTLLSKFFIIYSALGNLACLDDMDMATFPASAPRPQRILTPLLASALVV
jgi:hypothetical protein